jgi:hypothetical protein
MRTILHIGMPKTGSTAIQTGMAQARDHLGGAGVLFPENPPRSRFVNHNLLAAGFVPFDRLPRQFRNRYDAARLTARHREFVAHLQDQVAALRPACLVLSSEVLFRRISAADHAALMGDIGEGGTIQVVAYLRAPADHYVSSAQQILKAAHALKPLRTVRYAEVLGSYATAFGRDALAPRIFDRCRLVNGDVIDDFVATALAGFPVDPARIKAAHKPNETISAEAMILLRAYREAFHRDEENVYSKATSALIRLLQAADRAVGAPRPRLRPEYADYLNHCQPDPLLVRDGYGLEFPGIDYARLERGAFSTLAASPWRLEEIFVIDAGIRRDLAAAVARSRWVARSPERAAWIARVLQDLGGQRL